MVANCVQIFPHQTLAAFLSNFTTQNVKLRSELLRALALNCYDVSQVGAVASLFTQLDRSPELFTMAFQILISVFPSQHSVYNKISCFIRRGTTPGSNKTFDN